MNFLRKLTFTLLLTLGITTSNASDSGGMVHENLLQPCEAPETAVFYVHIFGGMLPIPTQYIAVIGSSPIIELNSRFEPGHPSSFIRMGSIQAYNEKIAPEYSNSDYVEEEFKSLSVKKFLPPKNIPQLKNISTVLIYDRAQFFLVTSADPLLWKQIIGELVKPGSD